MAAPDRTSRRKFIVSAGVTLLSTATVADVHLLQSQSDMDAAQEQE
jgi:hypothetical protein